MLCVQDCSWSNVAMPEPVALHNVLDHEVAEYECKNLPPLNRVFVRRAHHLDHYLGAERVQKQAWFSETSMSDVMVMENTNIRNPGGLVLVMTMLKNSHTPESVVGFAFSWGATGNRQGPNQDTYIFSNLVGVLPSHQGNNFATILKAEQRRYYLKWWDSAEFVGKRGAKRKMLWTVYPVLTGNHHLNFDCLGARCETFHPNLYGPISGGLYGGLPTDRLEMTWDLDNPRVLQINGEPDSLLTWSEEGPVQQRFFDAQRLDKSLVYQAAFPSNFQGLKADNFTVASRWQSTIGDLISEMISAGFYIAGYKRGKDYGNFIFLPSEV